MSAALQDHLRQMHTGASCCAGKILASLLQAGLDPFRQGRLGHVMKQTSVRHAIVCWKTSAPAKCTKCTRTACRKHHSAQAGQGLATKDTLAIEADLHRTFVAHVERQARNISLDNLERLAFALEVLPHKLLLVPAATDGHR